MNHLKNYESKEARDFLMEKIRSKFPQLEMLAARSRILIRLPDGREILSIEHTTNYFYISFEGQRYRVYSKSKIIEYKNGGRRYKGDIRSLITSTIIPHVRTKLADLI